MLTFRKDIMDKILQSNYCAAIKPMLSQSLQHRFEGKNSSSNMKRFIQYLESDLNFHLRQNHSKKEQRNLMEALRVIKTDFNTIEKIYE